MKELTITVQLQVDMSDDDDAMDYAEARLDEINHIVGELDGNPQFFRKVPWVLSVSDKIV